jgi:hypothetical protein
MARPAAKRMREGAVVRDRMWGGTHTGTVVRREGTSVFVAWHGTCVEDELDAGQVEVWADAPESMSHVRGGVGTVADDGQFRVRPLADRP